MKRLILFLLLLIPLFSFSQRKIYIRQAPDQNDAGFHLKKASTYLLAGTVVELLGSGLTIYGTTQKDTYNGYYTIKADKTPMYVGIGLAGAGLIFQIVGYIQIGKAGNSVRVNGNGMTFNF